jgi:hypothetical protein
VGPSIGIRWRVAYRRTVAIDLELGGGPVLGAEGWFFTLATGLTWRPVEHVGLTFGYRQIDADLEDGDYEFEGRLAGLFFGGTIRF